MDSAKVFKVIIWGTGKVFSQYINVIKYYESCNCIKVVAVTSNNMIFSKCAGYEFVCKEDLHTLNYDIVIIMADDAFEEIRKEAIKIGINREKIISFKLLNIPNINFEKYMNIIKDPPTIFSNNCSGGFIYNRLGLQFRSPLINMFEGDNDYIKLLSNPQYYMTEKLSFIGTKQAEVSKKEYPICACGDIVLHFNHYESFEEANICWERRKKRINWNNLFVMMFTENEKIAKQFVQLPYSKKICFVPFESNDISLHTIEFRYKNEMSTVPFFRIVNSMATGAIPYYNVIDLVHDGKITKLST